MIWAYALWTIAASVVTAAMYAWDKRAASRAKQRIAERTLLIASAVGGWPGALICGRYIRHKTAKLSYRIKFFVAMVVHLALSGALWQLLIKGA
ncbi:hypothetical protein Pla52n_05970 [Stieleria varia]|uniref:DUF1294 domain-containing protein n=2 Tax=Stieleria varia TaxID=2528005 RepID=A0A5C6B9M1_9BACT|nr:hypothetical protein Pla52n_05970 [Stieleria varia]